MLRLTVSRPECLCTKPHLRSKTKLFLDLLKWGVLSDERTDLSFTIAASSRQCSHSQVRVKRDSWSYFTATDSRLLQTGGLGPRIPEEQGGPVVPPGTGFPFRRLLRLSKLRWYYSNLPLHELT
jgi:hypothetical protein